MTLSTDIYILSPVEDPRELFDWINSTLLHAPKDVKFKDIAVGEPLYPEHPIEKLRDERATRREISNAPAQDLDAWLITYWTPEGEDQHYDKKIGDPGFDHDDARYENERADAIGGLLYGRINFDTAYGFRAEVMGKRIGCTELHAFYIYGLAKLYFEPRGIEFAWRNEYSGEIAQGLDKEAIERFLNMGEGAMQWFDGSVLPLLRAEAEAAGATLEL